MTSASTTSSVTRASSRSEDGEIRETQEVEKAPPSLPSVLGPSVDRHPSSRPPPSRDNSYEQSNRYSSKRRRSPSHDRSERDPRSFKPRYEPEHPATRGGVTLRRPRVSYADIDSGDARNDRDREFYDRERSKRSRTRSITPPSGPRGSRDYMRGRGGRYDERRRGETRDHRSRGSNEDSRRYRSRERSSIDGQAAAHLDHGRREAEANRDSVPREEMKNLHIESNGRQQETNTVVPLPEPVEIEEPVDEDKLIEERRKRREALRAKFRGQGTPALAEDLKLNTPSHDESMVNTTSGNDSLVSTPGEPKSPVTPASPMRGATPTGDFTITKGVKAIFDNVAEEPSAADYDPTMDMREDRTRKEQRRLEVSSGNYNEIDSEDRDVLMPDVATHQSSALAEPSKLNMEQQKNPPTDEDDFDMFAEGDDDIFAPDAPADTKKEEKVVGKAVPIIEVKQLNGGMLDNWDDEEGYYKIIPGELLDGRYRVHIQLGKGMFSGVIRATDTGTDKLVAIKIIRNSEAMRKAGMKELAILRQLHELNSKGAQFIVKLERYFEHKYHLCIVFEHLSLNLRDVLKQSGIRDVGISLEAVRAYAHQMFLGLYHLERCKIIHADIKPDNILVTDRQNVLKIADLGSASDVKDNEITPYLVSRFYRAPEIILGMPYDYSIDMWSVGCTLYELYTGKILFTGRTNNQMLKNMMECRGAFSKKLLKRGQFSNYHFDEMGNFLSREKDKITGKDVIRTITFTKPTRELKQRLLSAATGSESESKQLKNFADLLEQCLNLNPEKRCSPMQAINHAFIKNE